MLNPEDLAACLLTECRNPESSANICILLQQLSDEVKSSNDLQRFVGPVMKLLPCHNFEIKKSVYALLPRICALHPDTALLAANTIVKDCRDPNPNVKCIALSALCSLPQLLEHTNSVLLLLFEDGNPKVRHAAVLGCEELFRKDPDVVKQLGLVDRLYECIRDSDPVVIACSLFALDKILASEGGVVINRNIAHYLLKRLGDFPDVQLSCILQFLQKYTPESEEELFQELSVLDPYLSCSSSAAVTVSSINLFLSLSEKDYPYLITDIIKRALPVLKEFLQLSASKASVIIVLNFFMTMIYQKRYEWLDAIAHCPDLFYAHDKDDKKMLSKKFFILPYVCNEENCKTVLHNLLEKYCSSEKSSHDAIECISLIARRLSVDAGHECLKVFHALLDSKNNEICATVVRALQNIDLRSYDQNVVSNILYIIFSNTHLIHNANTVPVLTVLLGEFGELVESQSPFILESLIQNFETFEHDTTRILILTAGIKLFLKMPAKCQHMLGEIFEKCLFQNDSDTEATSELQNRARQYYLLLQHDVNLTKKILSVC